MTACLRNGGGEGLNAGDNPELTLTLLSFSFVLSGAVVPAVPEAVW